MFCKEGPLLYCSKLRFTHYVVVNFYRVYYLLLPIITQLEDQIDSIKKKEGALTGVPMSPVAYKKCQYCMSLSLIYVPS